MDGEKLICPYCGKEQYTHEDDDISAYLCLEMCEHCGKQFWYSVEVKRYYSPRKYDDAEEPDPASCVQYNNVDGCSYWW